MSHDQAASCGSMTNLVYALQGKRTDLHISLCVLDCEQWVRLCFIGGYAQEQDLQLNSTCPLVMQHELADSFNSLTRSYLASRIWELKPKLEAGQIAHALLFIYQMAVWDHIACSVIWQCCRTVKACKAAMKIMPWDKSQCSQIYYEPSPQASVKPPSVLPQQMKYVWHKQYVPRQHAPKRRGLAPSSYRRWIRLQTGLSDQISHTLSCKHHLQG